MNAGRSRARVAAVWPLVACLALFVLLVVAVNPLHDFPMGDDWEYARTVQRLLTTGQFYRSPVVQATAFFPALWGALFSSLLGFSFITLRLSTLPLAAGTLVAFYLILGELGFRPPRRLLGTLTLMVAPLFVFNALSFMTDVPFLFWLMLGLWCALRAFRLGRLGWLVAGSVCAALAFLTRQLGLALPAAAVVAVLVYRPRSDWPRWLAASVGVPLAATALFYAWQAVAGQTTWADATITDQGTLQFILNPQLPAALGRRIVVMLVSVNLYMAPLWLAFLTQFRQGWLALGRLGGRLRAAGARRSSLAGLSVGSIVAIFFFASVTYFGLRGDWWPYYRGSLTNAGLWPTLAYYAFPADVRPPFLPEPFWIVLTYIGTTLAVELALNLVVRFVGALNEPGEPTHPNSRQAGLRRWAAQAGCSALARLQALDPARGLAYLTFLALLALVLVYPLFVERYFLPILPGAIILLLEATCGLRPSRPLAAGGLLAVAIFSVGLMWDYYDWHAARWTNAQALVTAGVPLERLDAGYEWSGWYLSDQAYAYILAHRVPVTADPVQYVIDPEYMVTFTVMPGYQVAQEWPFYSPFRPGGADHLFLLKRVAAP
jgi:hypothetical protein